MGFMNKIGYLIGEGFRSVFKHGFMSFASVTIIIACLLIMGSFSLLAVNINALIAELESQNEMLAFVDEDLSRSDAEELEPYLLADPNVSEVVFVTKEEALENFKGSYDDDYLFDEIESDVFRDRYVVYLDDIAFMAETQQRLQSIDGVASVSAQLEISKGFVTVRNIVSAVSLILVVILFVVSVFIMNNTVKLTTFTRREEIAIMKMVGATNGFIRMPFLIEGLVLGVFGAIVAFFAQWGIYTLVCEQVMAGIAKTLFTVLPFTTLMLPVGLVFLAVGLIVGLFGGSIAIRNYLKV